ncbi:MAG: GNAT family N-acetyltransferase [Chloroflexota bacterium]
MRFRYYLDAHLSLELQTPDHAPGMLKLISENRAFIGQYMDWVQRLQTLPDAQKYLDRDLHSMAIGRRWAWMIRYYGQIVGRIGLTVTTPSLNECELYYFLAESATGKGIITRVTRVITTFAIGVLGLKHVLIGYVPSNVKSGAVAHRLGFQYEYRARDEEAKGDGWQDLRFAGMTADDWDDSATIPSFDYWLTENISLRLYQTYHVATKMRTIKRNKDELSRWFRWATDAYTSRDERKRVRERLFGYADNEMLNVAIWHENRYVGDAALRIDAVHESGMLSYWLDSSVRGQGIATRTATALLQYGFQERRLARIGAQIAESNTASRAVAERLGMQAEYFMRDERRIGGQFINHVQYGILADEWKIRRL